MVEPDTQQRSADDRAFDIALVAGDPEDLSQAAALLQLALGMPVRIRQVDDYDDALRLLRRQRFDIALVDLDLGPRSGLDLVRELGGREAPTPMILLANGAAEGADRQAILVGAYDFIDAVEINPRTLGRAIRYASHSHQLANVLLGALREAQGATRAKSDFLARMSHDLRTPLNAILGFSEIIKEQMFGAIGVPVYAAYANDIHVGAMQLLDMINDILDLARVESDQHKLQLRRLPVAAAIGEVVRLVRPTAAGGGIELAVDVRDGLDVVADERSLRRMLGNLISNSLKFTPSGGRIVVRAAARGDAVEIAVADTGIGIAPHQLEAVRAPFTQADSSILTAQTGAGLGLAIVDTLMQAHGGRLEIESELGVGTAVRLFFPNRDDADGNVGGTGEAA